MLVATRYSATKILCVRSRVHKILCTEKGRFKGYLVDILFISSLFKNALNLLLKCDLIYYSSVYMDDQGSGPRTMLAGDANADIMTSIIECVRARVLIGARTFMVKVSASRRTSQ